MARTSAQQWLEDDGTWVHHFAVWSRELTADEIHALHEGATADTIGRDALVMYLVNERPRPVSGSD
jgi:hypothetical protein